MTVKGRIYKGIGGFYYVLTASGVVECRARGRFRNENTIPMVGDYVEVDVQADSAYLVTIEPRRSFFKRPPVSNIDVLAIVASQAPPAVEPLMIDRVTAVAVHKGIEPLVLLNKTDIERAAKLYDIYSGVGIKTLYLSAHSGEGCDEFLHVVRGKTVAFSGVSGVGKSSILNRILPAADARIGALNTAIGRGRHTTRHVELFDLPGGTVVADTPGFSSFDNGNETRITYEELENCFVEFEPYLGKCQFVGCAHVKDKGCAVLAAVAEGAIAESRHASYCKMYTAAKEYNPYKS